MELSLKNGYYEFTRLLIEKGVNVNWILSDGETALHYILDRISGDTHLDIVQLFIDKGIHINTILSDF